VTALRLGDGTLIDTTSGKRTIATDINKTFSTSFDDKKSGKVQSSYETGKRRYLDDLPVPSAQSRPIAIVAAYTIFGLSIPDVAFLLKSSIEQVSDILESNEYKQFVEAMLQNIREHDESAVRKKLNKAADGAASKMVDLISATDKKIAFAAAKDILDRTGHKASDVVEHRHSMEDGIVIRVIDDTKAKQPIDVEI